MVFRAGATGNGLYSIANVAVDETAWWPVTAPRDCNGFKLRCSVDVHLRSDPNDSTTEDDLPAGMVEECLHTQNSREKRFAQGQAVMYVKSQQGASTVYVRFID